MTNPRFDTIVVGAGVSGLTVGQLLSRAGQRVVVLEARDRIGGRVHSERVGDHVLELGASWIHGIDDEPLADVVRAFGMREVEFTVGSYQPDSRPIAYFGPDGARLSTAQTEAFCRDLHTFSAALAATIAATPPGHTFEQAIDQTLGDFGWDPERAQRVREYTMHRAEEQYGVHGSLLDAHGLDDEVIVGDEVVFPDGYGALADNLAVGLDIRLDCAVDRIRWSDDRASVSANGTEFDADRVVVTVPVGVLKSDALTIDPPLPASIATALDGFEMNAFEKVYLTFDAKFWDDDVYAFRRQGERGAWWHSWYDLSRITSTPTLLTFAAGPAAIATREWDDDAVAASVLAALVELYGDRVSVPTSVTVTRWQDDPFARGSYAYMKPGSVTSDHDLLATPVGGGVLHLAGEATWTEDPATVPAALRSGHRAAERILGRPIDFSELSPAQ